MRRLAVVTRLTAVLDANSSTLVGFRVYSNPVARHAPIVCQWSRRIRSARLAAEMKDRLKLSVLIELKPRQFVRGFWFSGGEELLRVTISFQLSLLLATGFCSTARASTYYGRGTLNYYSDMVNTSVTLNCNPCTDGTSYDIPVTLTGGGLSYPTVGQWC
jgi:hypothetical protein